jgi:large subunit ribosomal protein L23
MEATRVIRGPLITEKATAASEHNRYVFAVDMHATKPQIREAVEALYGVHVVSVATQIRKGQMRRNRYGLWSTRDQKRAIVKVREGERIEFF